MRVAKKRYRGKEGISRGRGRGHFCLFLCEVQHFFKYSPSPLPQRNRMSKQSQLAPELKFGFYSETNTKQTNKYVFFIMRTFWSFTIQWPTSSWAVQRFFLTTSVEDVVLCLYRPLARPWECSQSEVQNNKIFLQKRKFLLFCPPDWLHSLRRARGLLMVYNQSLEIQNTKT